MTRVKHCALALIVVIAAAGSYGQVTFERLVNAAKEPQNWLTYSGDYAGRRFSPLDQINTANARSLVAKWVYQTAATGKFETTPLVVDGILYATGQDDRAFALDARTGRPIWLYQRQLPSDIRPCCGRVNRGLAILGDKVFMATLDAHVIALDAKTGNLIWDVQSAKHGEHDWYATQLPIMIDSGGKHLIAQANRNGFFYVVDRTNGKLLSANSYAKTTWSGGKDAEGRPVANKESSPTPEGRTVCPGAIGSTNWMSPTFHSQTGLFYVTAREECDIFSTAPQPYEAGHAYYGSAYFPSDKAEPYWGALRALDPTDGQLKWEFRHISPTYSGVLSTAGGLLFTGDAEGNFIALDAASGKPLWHFQMGGAVYASPMAFAVDGKEYVAIAAVSSLYTFGLP